MITIDNSISNNQPELSSSISHSCHFGDLWSRKAPGAGFGMSGGSQTLPWHSEGGMDRRESWQTKKVVFFWARSRWGNGFQQKSNYTVCHVCHSQLSWLMSETVQHNVWHGKLKLTPLLEFLTKWYQKDMARHALALSCEFHSENFAGNWHHSYIII